jgi:3-mercaptopyruvate sulfurtransferase SseA
LASLAYETLYARGFRNLRILDEGIPGWIEQGQPTEGAVSGYVPNHERDYATFLGRAAGLP